MNACCTYNDESNKPIPEIMALPIDFNENGQIDEKESFYEDLCKLDRAFYLGIMPFELCSDIYLMSKAKPSDPAQLEFISWVVTRGQLLAEQNGYARIRSSRAEEILHMLQPE